MPNKSQVGGGGSVGIVGGGTTAAGGTRGTRTMRNTRKPPKGAVTKNDSGVGKGTYGWGFDTTRKGFRMTVSKQLKKVGNTVGKPSAKKGLKAVKVTKQNNRVLIKAENRNQTAIAKGGRNVLVKKTKSANVLKKGKK